MMSDSGIRAAVLRALASDGRLAGATVDVTVDDGVVALAGVAASPAQRLAGQEAAHRAPGVLDVANNVRVRSVGGLIAPDTRIAQAVRRALTRDVGRSAGRIRSTVADGWVTLEGVVDGWQERETAEGAVRPLVGVRGVTDRIAVRVPSGPAAVPAAEAAVGGSSRTPQLAGAVH